MRVTRLEGRQLDYWVAKSAGMTLLREAPANPDGYDVESGTWHPSIYHPSSDWSQSGSIVANEWYDIEDFLFAWFGPSWPDAEAFRKAPLTWFMRAYVAANFGDEVDDPVAAYPGDAPGVMGWALGGLRRLGEMTGLTLRNHRP